MRNWLFGIVIMGIVLAGVFFGINFSNLPPELPWFYSLPWGEAILIGKIWFGVGLAVLLLITGINFLLAIRFEKTDLVVTNVIAGATLLLAVIYLASFFRVLMIMI